MLMLRTYIIMVKVHEIEEFIDSEKMSMASVRTVCLVWKKRDRIENFRSRQHTEKNYFLFVSSKMENLAVF